MVHKRSFTKFVILRRSAHPPSETDVSRRQPDQRKEKAHGGGAGAAVG
jgi:hypothetical protein